MKITKTQLKQIIKEEMEKVLNEELPDWYKYGEPEPVAAPNPPHKGERMFFENDEFKNIYEYDAAYKAFKEDTLKKEFQSDYFPNAPRATVISRLSCRLQAMIKTARDEGIDFDTRKPVPAAGEKSLSSIAGFAYAFLESGYHEKDVDGDGGPIVCKGVDLRRRNVFGGTGPLKKRRG